MMKRRRGIDRNPLILRKMWIEKERKRRENQTVSFQENNKLKERNLKTGILLVPTATRSKEVIRVSMALQVLSLMLKTNTSYSWSVLKELVGSFPRLKTRQIRIIMKTGAMVRRSALNNFSSRDIDRGLKEWDATAAGPKLPVNLNSYWNNVPVQRHWSQNGKFCRGPPVATMEPGLEEEPLDRSKNCGDLEEGEEQEEIEDDELEDGIQSVDSLSRGPPAATMEPGLEEEPVDRSKNCGELEEGEEQEEIEDDELEDGIQSVDSLSRGPPAATMGPGLEEEPAGRSNNCGDLEEGEEQEEIEDDELEEGIQSVDSLSSTPRGAETPDIHLLKQQRKEPEKALYQVYLLRGQKSNKVDVTLKAEELEGVESLDNVLVAPLQWT